MHPRTWGRIVKAREVSAPSTYLIGSGSTVFGRRGNDPLPGYANAQTPRGELFGLPVFTTSNVPTNLGAPTKRLIRETVAVSLGRVFGYRRLADFTS